MKTIKKLVVSNFKRFKSLELEFDDTLNVLIGDNEAGKSSVLLAIDLALSGSRSKIETIGLESLLNCEVVSEFQQGGKTFDLLPTMFVELYFHEQDNYELNGKQNSKNIVCDGLRLECRPDEELSKEVAEMLRDPKSTFPFEYYSIDFKTFAGDQYSGFKRPLKHLAIDSSQINNDYATKEYTRSIYGAAVTEVERNRHEYLYRQAKTTFKEGALKDLNNKSTDYKFRTHLINSII